MKGENYTKIHDFNDASANEKNGCEKQKKNPKSQSFQGFSGMVRMTGFEPTRISSLEPETSASAVPPHPHFFVFRPLFLHGKDTRGGAYFEFDSFSILRKLYKNAFLRIYLELHRGDVT